MNDSTQHKKKLENQMRNQRRLLTGFSVGMAAVVALLGIGAGTAQAAAFADSGPTVATAFHPNVGQENCNAEVNPIKFYFPNTYTCFGGSTGSENVNFAAVSMQSGDYGGNVTYDNNNGCWIMNFSPYHTYTFAVSSIINDVTTTERG